MSMNMKHRIVAMLLTGALCVNSIPLMSVTVGAEDEGAARAPRTPFQGITLEDEMWLTATDTSVADTSWYTGANTAAGTEDDPYIIDTPEKFLALSEYFEGRADQLEIPTYTDSTTFTNFGTGIDLINLQEFLVYYGDTMYLCKLDEPINSDVTIKRHATIDDYSHTQGNYYDIEHDWYDVTINGASKTVDLAGFGEGYTSTSNLTEFVESINNATIMNPYSYVQCLYFRDGSVPRVSLPEKGIEWDATEFNIEMIPEQGTLYDLLGNAYSVNMTELLANPLYKIVSDTSAYYDYFYQGITGFTHTTELSTHLSSYPLTTWAQAVDSSYKIGKGYDAGYLYDASGAKGIVRTPGEVPLYTMFILPGSNIYAGIKTNALEDADSIYYLQTASRYLVTLDFDLAVSQDITFRVYRLYDTGDKNLLITGVYRTKSAASRIARLSEDFEMVYYLDELGASKYYNYGGGLLLQSGDAVDTKSFLKNFDVYGNVSEWCWVNAQDVGDTILFSDAEDIYCTGYTTSSYVRESSYNYDNVMGLYINAPSYFMGVLEVARERKAALVADDPVSIQQEDKVYIKIAHNFDLSAVTDYTPAKVANAVIDFDGHMLRAYNNDKFKISVFAILDINSELHNVVAGGVTTEAFVHDNFGLIENSIVLTPRIFYNSDYADRITYTLAECGAFSLVYNNFGTVSGGKFYASAFDKCTSLIVYSYGIIKNYDVLLVNREPEYITVDGVTYPKLTYDDTQRWVTDNGYSSYYNYGLVVEVLSGILQNVSVDADADDIFVLNTSIVGNIADCIMRSISISDITLHITEGNFSLVRDECDSRHTSFCYVYDCISEYNAVGSPAGYYYAENATMPSRPSQYRVYAANTVGMFGGRFYVYDSTFKHLITMASQGACPYDSYAASQYYNCTIDIKLQGTEGDSSYVTWQQYKQFREENGYNYYVPTYSCNFLCGSVFDNCNINVEVLNDEIIALAGSVISNFAVIRDTDINIRGTLFVSDSGYISWSTQRAEVSNSNFYFERATGRITLGNVHNCSFVVDELYSNGAFIYACSVADSSLDVKKCGSRTAVPVNIFWADEKAIRRFSSSITYSGKCDLTFGYVTNECASYKDSTLFFIYDTTCKGDFVTPLNVYCFKNTFIYMDMQSPEATFDATCPSILSRRSSAFYVEDTTLIAPRINIQAATSEQRPGYYDNNNVWFWRDSRSVPVGVQNLNIYANIYLKDTQAVTEASKIEACVEAQNNILDSTLDCSFYMYDGTFANLPVSAFSAYYNYSSYGSHAIYNTTARISTASPLVSFARADTTNNSSIVNCFFDAPSSIPSTEQIESPVNAPAFRGGLFQLAVNNKYNTIENVADAAKATRNKSVFLGSCYIPEGQSAVCEVYTGTGSDTWSSPVADGQPAGSYGFYDGALPEGVQYVSTDAWINGEAAYLLDSGYSPIRRGYNWTVFDDIQFMNPKTQEVLGTWPAHTGTTQTYLPDAVIYSVGSISGELENYPIYKVDVTAAADGYLTINGVGGTTTTDGTLYAKRGANLGAEETILNDDTILVYATQSLNNSSPVRIASTATDSEIQTYSRYNQYTIAGYKQQGADTVITPVFKTARYVTVTVDDATHGTLIPSVNVTAAGEKVSLETQAEPGYMVTDITYHTAAEPTVEIPVSNKAFIMPDDDVVVSAKIVPFDGGITAFSLFGFVGEIDQDAGTIHVDVPKTASLHNLQPSIEYVGDYITPAATARRDFENPVTYTVTYGDGLTKDYVVTVEQSEYSLRIYDFVLLGVHGNINQVKHTIDIELPAGTDLSALQPDEIVYSAENISPTVTAVQDYRAPVVYTLHANEKPAVEYTVNVTTAADGDAEITRYTVSGYDGVIDQTANTITVTVPSGINLTAVAPSFVEYIGKRITPNKPSRVDLSEGNAVTYTVTAQNDTQRNYVVTANYVSDDTAKITEFSLGGYTGVIDEAAKKITVTVPRTANLQGIIPDTLLYEGKSIYPKKTIEQDFTQPVVYTVVAADNTEVPYTVNVVTVNSEALITEFALLGIDGVIDQTEKTIHVTLPYGYDVSNTAPSKLVYSENATLTPNAGTARDFTVAQTYTVVSEDGLTTNTYTVICEVADAYDNRILKYTLDGVDGTITDIGIDKGIINIVVHDRVDAPDYNSIVPDDIIVSTGATLNPVKTTAVDLIENVPQYKVTGRTNGERIYDVYLTIVPMDTTAQITEFAANGRQGIINQEAGTITITAPSAERTAFENCVPVITWRGASLTPADGAHVDLTTEQTYVVKAEDPRVTKSYKVTVQFTDEPLDTTCILTAYSVGGYVGTVDQTARTITITPVLSRQEELKNVVPDYVRWEGAALMPAENAAIDLTAENSYRVVAEDSTIYKDYRLIVDWVDDRDTKCIITAYKIHGVSGVIDQNAGTITVKLDKKLKAQSTSVVPNSITWHGASLTPTEQSAVNLTETVTYRVTAENPAIYKDYRLVITWVDDDEPTPPTPPRPVVPVSEDCIITYYSAAGIVGDIDQQQLTITMNVPLSRKAAIIDVVPDRIDWEGKTLTPAERDVVTLKDGLTYTVYAEKAGVKKTYTVKLNWVDDRDTDCIITYYEALGIVGVINQDDLTITMDIPLSRKAEISDVVPNEIRWYGKVLEPDEKAAVTLVDGLEYTVYAEKEGICKTYTIKLNWVDDRDTSCDITYYEICGEAASIDQITGEMRVTLSADLKGQNVVPNSIIWHGAELTPTEDAAVVLEEGQEYRVYAENRAFYKDYCLYVDWEEEPVTEDVPTDEPDDTEEIPTDEPEDTEEPPTDEPEDNPNTGIVEDKYRYMRYALLAMLAAGVLIYNKKRGERK